MANISIIVPVHNAKNYIETTVKSVLDQSCTDFELLLIEDASTDDTLSVMNVLAKKDERIRVIVNHGKHGAAAARNLGIAAAKGRYLCYIDADDIWMPDKLEKQLAFMKEKDAAFSFTSYEFADAECVGTGKIVHAPEWLDLERAYTMTVIFTSTVMFDLEKIDKELIKMPYIKSEDTACWWNILGAGYKAYGLDENLTLYRRPKKSLSSNKAEALRRIWMLYRKHAKLSLFKSIICFIGWGFRAAIRRI